MATTKCQSVTAWLTETGGIAHIGDRCERLRPAAGLSEEAEASRIRAELRSHRGDHRRRAAAGGAPGLVVGDRAQPAGEDAAARSLPRRWLHRDKAGRRQK